MLTQIIGHALAVELKPYRCD